MKKVLAGAGITSAAIIFSVAVASNVDSLTPFKAGEVAKADDVNKNFTALQQAINDNNSRLGVVEGKVDGGNGGGACPPGMADMVGFCLDQNEVSFTIPGGCNADGTGCGSLVPSTDGNGTTGLGAGNGITWFQAAVACANAGKRLPTNQEWSVGFALAQDKQINGMRANPREWIAEWANSAGANNVNPGRGISQPNNGPNDTGDVIMAALYRGFGPADNPAANRNNIAANVTPFYNTDIGFRCAADK